MSAPYRILVTGPRDYRDKLKVRLSLAEAVTFVTTPDRTVVVHGACPSGVDAMADEWAAGYGCAIEAHPAQNFGAWPWCGPARNSFMVSLGADICLAFYQPCSSPKCKRTDEHGSHGTASCAGLAEKAGIPVKWVGQ